MKEETFKKFEETFKKPEELKPKYRLSDDEESIITSDGKEFKIIHSYPWYTKRLNYFTYPPSAYIEYIAVDKNGRERSFVKKEY